MNGRNKVTELLKDYPMYKAAIRDYEKPYNVGEVEGLSRYMVAAPCRTAIWSDMPSGTGSGSRAPTLTGNWSLDDMLEYEEYKFIVRRTEIALDALNTEERSIVSLKWFDDITLEEISHRKRFSLPTVKRIHRRALEKLEIGLRFVKPMKELEKSAV